MVAQKLEHRVRALKCFFWPWKVGFKR